MKVQKYKILVLTQHFHKFCFQIKPQYSESFCTTILFQSLLLVSASWYTYTTDGYTISTIQYSRLHIWRFLVLNQITNPNHSLTFIRCWESTVTMHPQMNRQDQARSFTKWFKHDARRSGWWRCWGFFIVEQCSCVIINLLHTLFFLSIIMVRT